jgi:hypothetical protein
MKIKQTFLFETDFFMNKKDINNHLFKKNSKVCTQLRIFQKEIKSKLNQELMHIHSIRRKRLICKSDYYLKSGCT